MVGIIPMVPVSKNTGRYELTTYIIMIGLRFVFFLILSRAWITLTPK